MQVIKPLWLNSAFIPFTKRSPLQIFETNELTRNGSQNIGDEHIHQSLVEEVVALFSPAQKGLKLAEQHQAGLGQTLLRLVVSTGQNKLLRDRTNYSQVVCF